MPLFTAAEMPVDLPSLRRKVRLAGISWSAEARGFTFRPPAVRLTERHTARDIEQGMTLHHGHVASLRRGIKECTLCPVGTAGDSQIHVAVN
jgi:hypothetical protein